MYHGMEIHSARGIQGEGGGILVRSSNRTRLKRRATGNFRSIVGTPHADALKASEHANMKELRFAASDGVRCVTVAFDTARQFNADKGVGWPPLRNSGGGQASVALNLGAFAFQLTRTSQVDCGVKFLIVLAAHPNNFGIEQRSTIYARILSPLPPRNHFL